MLAPFHLTYLNHVRVSVYNDGRPKDSDVIPEEFLRIFFETNRNWIKPTHVVKQNGAYVITSNRTRLELIYSAYQRKVFIKSIYTAGQSVTSYYVFNL